MTLRTFAALSVLPIFAVSILAAQAKPVVAPPRLALRPIPDQGVTRETLPSGLRVVLVHNALAPVVTVELNILAGGNETPDGFPGMAHALEHMAFRGCKGMTADQTAAPHFVQGLGLFSATAIVMGSMIGSGIFIVSAEMSAWLKVAVCQLAWPPPTSTRL